MDIPLASFSNCPLCLILKSINTLVTGVVHEQQSGRAPHKGVVPELHRLPSNPKRLGPCGGVSVHCGD